MHTYIHTIMEANRDHSVMNCFYWGSIFWSRKSTWEKVSRTFQNENCHSWHILETQKIHTTHTNSDYTFFRGGTLPTLNCKTLTKSIGYNVEQSKPQLYLQWLSLFSKKMWKIIKINLYPTFIPEEKVRHKITILYSSALFSFLPLWV